MSYKEQIKTLTAKLKQAEARAEFAEKSVQKLQKEVKMPLLCGHDEYGSHDEEAYFAEESVQKMQKEVKMTKYDIIFLLYRPRPPSNLFRNQL